MPTKNKLESGTDVSKGIFSPSAIELYLRCPRKFYLQYIKRIQPIHAPSPLIFGEAVHEGIAALRCSSSLREATIAAITILTKRIFFDGYPRDIRTLIIILYQHYVLYKEKYDPNLIEVPFQLTFPNGTMCVGIIDAIYRAEHGIDVIDTKTSSGSLTEWFWKNYQNSFPLSCYYHAAEEILGSCNSVIIDAISIKTPHLPESYARRGFTRSTKQMEEFINTWLQITDQITEMVKKGGEEILFYQNNTSCGDYGGCSFLNLCNYGWVTGVREKYEEKPSHSLEEKE